MGRLAELRDRVIEADVEDVLQHDPRLQGSAVEARADGGVVHLRGQVRDRRQLDDLRRLVRRLRHVLAVWDLVAPPGPDPVVVDLGCGGTLQRAGAHGVDRRITTATSVVADLDRGVPFGDRTVDHVFAVHLLEHLQDPLAFLADIHRIVRPGGLVHVMVPYWKDSIAVADPTHKHFFAPETFQAFCDGTALDPPFRPLLLTRSDDTVFADLQPVSPPQESAEDDLARWFDTPLS